MRNKGINDTRPTDWDTMYKRFMEEEKKINVETGNTFPAYMEDEEIIYPDEFLDFYEILDMGAKKYSPLGFMESNGPSTSIRDNHASLCRHIAEYYTGKTADDESGLHPLLHVATRALIGYARWKRGIEHEDD